MDPPAVPRDHVTTAHDPHLHDFNDGPRPGGTRRFLIAAAIALLLLAAVVLGMYKWMQATSKLNYQGPDHLKFPEHRYYR